MSEALALAPEAVQEEDYCGAKIALLCGERVLVYLRDAFAHIPHPDCWDLPGGGRENGESPDACALRELFEEFGLALDASRIVWRRRYRSVTSPGENTFFMAAYLAPDEIADIRFGDEGQHWLMMPVEDFLSHERGVPHLQARLRDFLAAGGGERPSPP